MQNLISITKSEIGNTELNSVNARDIHNYLEVKTKFSMWIQRAISKYDFKENVDYLLAIPKNGNGGKFENIEYIVTIDMAKELAMLENNEKGKEIRKYFIKVEKEYFDSLSKNSNELNFYKEKYFEALERENDLLRNMINNDLPPIMKPVIPNTNFTMQEIEEIKELRKQGFSIRQIAKIINRSTGGVYNYVSTFMEISYKQKSIIEETGKIKELLEKGYKTKEISKMLNIKRVTIYNRIRRMKNEN